MILRDKSALISNAGWTSAKPKIQALVILQESESVTNASIENVESEYVKIWVPKFMRI